MGVRFAMASKTLRDSQTEVDARFAARLACRSMQMFNLGGWENVVSTNSDTVILKTHKIQIYIK